MAVKKVITFKDRESHILQEACTRFDFHQPGHMDQLKNLIETFNSLSNAKGLAMPQIGYPSRAFIMVDSLGVTHVMCNPMIKGAIGRIKWDEECLSFPGKKIKRKLRRKIVQVEYFDRNENFRRKVFSGFDAACILHENDHLDGITIFKINQGDESC